MELLRRTDEPDLDGNFSFKIDDNSTIALHLPERMPETVKAIVLGYPHPQNPERYVYLERLEFLQEVTCGIRESSVPGVTWSNPTVHVLYHYKHDPERLFMISQDGLGTKFYLFDAKDFLGTFQRLRGCLSNNELWDVCQAYHSTYYRGSVNGNEAATKKIKSAFVDGRLSKRKSGDTHVVYIADKTGIKNPL